MSLCSYIYCLSIPLPVGLPRHVGCWSLATPRFCGRPLPDRLSVLCQITSLLDFTSLLDSFGARLSVSRPGSSFIFCPTEGGMLFGVVCVLFCVLCAPQCIVLCNKMLRWHPAHQYTGNLQHTGYCRNALGKMKTPVSPYWGLNVGIKENEGLRGVTNAS